jgi:hypothetical protein
MKRLIVVTLAFLVGCNGMGSGSRLLPASPDGAAGSDARAAMPGALAAPLARGRRTKVKLTITIPRRHRRETAAQRHPSTISSATQSIGIAINGGTQQIFNTTPSSAGCQIGPSGTTCTFTINANVGSDSLAVTTYSAAGGGGTALDHGTATVNIVAGKANTPAITLGPVVSITADSGVGSLRYAIGAANNGDTIMFLLPAGSTIVLSTPITITTAVSVAGPGVTASARRESERHSHTTYSGLTLSGNNTQQIFSIKAGATVTISGLILTAGQAAVAHNPGGAIGNLGTLSLVGDTFTGNASVVQTIVGRHHRTRAVRPHPPGKGRYAARLAHTERLRPDQLHPHACSSTYFQGGAVYNSGTLNISGTTFDGNTAASNFFPSGTNCEYGLGGAIYNDSNGVLTSSGDIYTNNSAYEGGAIYNDAYAGQMTFTSDTFTSNTGCTATTGCPSSGCVSGSTCASESYGYGAGIYDDDGPGATISGSVFSNNVVGNSPDGNGDGGALYLETGSPSVTGSTFSGNVAGGGTSNCASGEGGAMYVDASSLQLSNDTFTSNSAGGDSYGDGGAIYSYTTMTGNTDSFTGNTATGTGSACSNNGEAEGGAIYSDDGVSLSSSTFSGNTATAAYYSVAGAVYLDDPSVMSSDAFTSNTAVATGFGTPTQSSASGGAIYADDSLTLSGSTFTSNSVTVAGSDPVSAEGGAIDNEALMSSTRNTFASNSVSGPATGGASRNYGGGVYNDSSFISSGDIFRGNAASGTDQAEGGGVFSDDTLSLNGATITSNSVTGPSSFGGGLYSSESGSVLTNSVVSGNTANASTPTGTGYGGGVDDEDGLTVGGSTISNNVAASEGGGLYLDATDVIANSNITGNTATLADNYGGGGGIYGDEGFTITNSTVSGNTAGVSSTLHSGGGGIYNNAGITMMGSTLSGNSVTGSGTGDGGGGIFNYDNATIQNSTITGNRSSIDGGGFLQYTNYTVSLINDTFYQNTATGLGGNIDNPYDITLTTSIVAGGSAATGPDIANAGTITSGNWNLIQTAINPAGTIAGTTTNNFPVGTDPLLLALSNNGGPTFTNADQQTSPGRAVVPFSGSQCNAGGAASNVDQRGFSRGTATAGFCDVGAYEFGGTPGAARTRIPTPKQPHHAKKRARRSLPPPRHVN